MAALLLCPAVLRGPYEPVQAPLLANNLYIKLISVEEPHLLSLRPLGHSSNHLSPSVPPLHLESLLDLLAPHLASLKVFILLIILFPNWST